MISCEALQYSMKMILQIILIPSTLSSSWWFLALMEWVYFCNCKTFFGLSRLFFRKKLMVWWIWPVIFLLLWFGIVSKKIASCKCSFGFLFALCVYGWLMKWLEDLMILLHWILHLYSLLTVAMKFLLWQYWSDCLIFVGESVWYWLHWKLDDVC